MPKMKRLVIFAIIAAVVIVGVIAISLGGKPKETPSQVSTTQTKTISNMKISSSAFGNNEKIPKKFTCDGQDLNPPLKFEEVPQNAKSLVLIMDDPDAPGRIFVHWTIWNIPPETREIAENTVPAGAVLGMTDFGKAGYGGPCPPSGTHRYFFKLYALDTTLQLPSSATKAEVEALMSGHILSQTELIGLYSRR